MKKELQKQLFDKYPKIFRQKDLSMKETCMCWGIDTGDGWYNLLDMLCDQLQFNTERNKYPQIEATQVKEKFGALRFYYQPIPTEQSKQVDEEWQNRNFGEQEGLISFAEFMSGYICEKCGTNQKVERNDEGWIVTLCDKCRTHQGTQHEAT